MNMTNHQDHIDEAIVTATRILDKNPKDEQALSMRGLAHQMRGDLDAGIRDLTALLDISDAYEWERFMRGCMLLQAGRYIHAIKDFDWVLEIYPDHAWCHELRAMARFALSGVADASTDAVSAMLAGRKLVPVFAAKPDELCDEGAASTAEERQAIILAAMRSPCN